jgi:hypothetical protein
MAGEFSGRPQTVCHRVVCSDSAGFGTIGTFAFPVLKKSVNMECQIWEKVHRKNKPRLVRSRGSGEFHISSIARSSGALLPLLLPYHGGPYPPNVSVRCCNFQPFRTGVG